MYTLKVKHGGSSKVYHYASMKKTKGTYWKVKDPSGDYVQVLVVGFEDGVSSKATKWRTGGVVTSKQRIDYPYEGKDKVSNNKFKGKFQVTWGEKTPKDNNTYNIEFNGVRYDCTWGANSHITYSMENFESLVAKGTFVIVEQAAPSTEDVVKACSVFKQLQSLSEMRGVGFSSSGNIYYQTKGMPNITSVEPSEIRIEEMLKLVTVDPKKTKLQASLDELLAKAEEIKNQIQEM